MNDIAPGLGLRLKLAMKNSGMTQTSLAKALNISQSAIQRCISGRNYLEFKNIVKAAQILNVSLDWLANGNGNGTYDAQDTIGMNNTPIHLSLIHI